MRGKPMRGEATPEDLAEVDRFRWFLKARGKPGPPPGVPFLIWMAQSDAQAYLGVDDEMWRLLVFEAYHWLGR